MENSLQQIPFGYLYVWDVDSGKNGVANCRLLDESFQLIEEENSLFRVNKTFLQSKYTNGGNFLHMNRNQFIKTYSIMTSRSFDREETPLVMIPLFCEDGGKNILYD